MRRKSIKDTILRISNGILDKIKIYKGFATDSEMAKYFGVRQSVVSSWRNRNTVPYKEFLDFCKKEGLDIQELLDGRIKTVKKAMRQEPEKWVDVLPVGKNAKPFLVPKSLQGAGEGCLVTIKIPDNSFVPVCEAGDTLIVNAAISKNEIKEGKNYALKEGKNFSVAYVKVDSKGNKYLVPYDPAGEIKRCKDCQLLGEIVGLWREFGKG